jgi:hypothetical protein
MADGLGDGRVAATYDPKDAPMSQYVRGVFDIVKREGKKVYLVDQETGTLSAKPDPKLRAWPDAVCRYNGRNNQYLIHGGRRWVAK